MIKQIEIQNFQSWKHAVFTFDENGVNVITGSSDCGKSAIIRALVWVVWNKPSGDSFRSYWGGTTEVKITLNDNTTITRIRSNTDNEYYLNDKRFVSFNQDVPEEITEVFNMSAINLQKQLDAPFLLTDTPGQVAAHFNKVAGIDAIHDAEKAINRKINTLKSDIERTTDDLEEFKTELESFPNLEKIEKRLIRLERWQKQSEQIEKNKIDLLQTAKDIKRLLQEIEEKKQLTQLEHKVISILELIQQEKEITQNKRKLDDVIQNIQNNTKRVKKYKKLTVLEQTVIDLLDKMATQAGKQGFLRTLRSLIDNTIFIEKSLQKTLLNMSDLEKEYAELFPDICPLCGTSKKHIHL